mgnify:CR=1 FL=1
MDLYCKVVIQTLAVVAGLQRCFREIVQGFSASNASHRPFIEFQNLISAGPQQFEPGGKGLQVVDADGPFGDHMGFYGGEEPSPLVRFQCVTQRRDPIYFTTFSGRPPKEDAMLAIALIMVGCQQKRWN